MNRVNEPFDFRSIPGGELYLNYLVCQQFERAKKSDKILTRRKRGRRKIAINRLQKGTRAVA